VTDTYFGVTVHDPYRWLEDADAAPVKQWIREQNAYTERILGSFPERDAIAKRVGELALTSTQRDAPVLAAGRLFYLQQTPPQPQPVLAAADWPSGAPKVLYDPNASAGTAITAYWPSPDGRYVAFGTAEGGSEATTIRVLRVADGKVLADALAHAGGGTTPQALAWDADGKGMLYARLPDSGSQFDAAIFHHALGQPASADAVVFGSGMSPVAEYSFATSADGRRRAILVHFGDGDPDRVFLEQRGKWKQVLGPEANVRSAAAWQGDRLLVIAYQGAPRGKLLAVAPAGTSEVLVPEQARAMQNVLPLKNGFLLETVWGASWGLDQYDLKGKLVRPVPIPEPDVAPTDVASNDASDQALVAYRGFTFPGRWGRYDAKSGALDTVFEIRPAADYTKLVVTHLDAVSRDGTKVPVTVVAARGTRPDGRRPTIVTAYGGYKIALRPRFVGRYLAWLERGGVWAMACIRGGGELGEGWHEAGMLGSKQNGFDDFAAAVDALKSSGWTDTRHVGVIGGSNGGLLMGAEITQHPDAIRAAVSFVGIYDMLRSETFPNGRYNVSEYGTVREEPAFRWLDAYSPLERVRRGTAYPAVLLVTGENDPRVAPWQSRKFAAALQAATSSDLPILALTRTHEGHGVTASFGQRVGNDAAALAFFAHELELP